MSLRNNNLTDENAEKNGFWHTLDYNDDGTPIEFLLGRKGGSNEKFGKVIARLTKPHLAAIASGNLPDKLSLDINYRAFAEGVLFNWANVKASELDPTKEGDLVYSVENALELFKALPGVYDKLNTVVMNESNFLVSTREKVKENL